MELHDWSRPTSYTVFVIVLVHVQDPHNFLVKRLVYLAHHSVVFDGDKLLIEVLFCNFQLVVHSCHRVPEENAHEQAQSCQTKSYVTLFAHQTVGTIFELTAGLGIEERICAWGFLKMF